MKHALSVPSTKRTNAAASEITLTIREVRCTRPSTFDAPPDGSILVSGLSIPRGLPTRIGHPGSSGTGQVADIVLSRMLTRRPRTHRRGHQSRDPSCLGVRSVCGFWTTSRPCWYPRSRSPVHTRSNRSCAAGAVPEMGLTAVRTYAMMGAFGAASPSTSGPFMGRSGLTPPGSTSPQSTGQ